MGWQTFTVRRRVRRDFQTAARRLGLTPVEYRGLFSSTFVVGGSRDAIGRLAQWMNLTGVG